MSYDHVTSNYRAMRGLTWVPDKPAHSELCFQRPKYSHLIPLPVNTIKTPSSLFEKELPVLKDILPLDKPPLKHGASLS